ncbi:hypothetical protein HH214_12055 [Mucilaginibacter robiniae]|uniref:Uncharacterized protein n=1 Tax=Mucilaginibacter robiniae TaxID=2728022 RepID=A0A7L5E1Z4_9SPHI|nr:hypothetical protein [Mucilaginibacter robiniae]QJD96558.1 hypothetical protein HH214_12055 [Mucilaginibacter robiniae]
MRKILIIMVASFMSYSCTAQEKVDLEKLTFKEDPRVLVKNRKKSADRTEPLTSLPAYTTYDIAGYNFGPVALTEDCFVSYLLNSVEDKKLVGLIIGFETDATSKAINKYIFSHYSKPVVLEPEVQKKDRNNKLYPSSSAYLWRNVKPGLSLLLSKSHPIENGKLVENTNVVLINNMVKPSYETNFKTVLDRVIKTYKP